MDIIPDDLVILIIEYINYVDIVNLGQVNKRFFAICDSEIIINIIVNKYFQIHEMRGLFSRIPKHKIILKFLEKGIISFTWINDMISVEESIDEKYLSQYLKYVFDREIKCQRINYKWFKILLISEMNEHNRNDLIKKFIQHNQQIINQFIYDDTVASFLLENGIQYPEENKKMLCNRFSTVELLIHILKLNPISQYSAICERICRINNYDMIEVFLNHVSHNNPKKKLREYIKRFFPLQYDNHYFKLFEGRHPNVMNKYIKTQMNFMKEIIGSNYSIDDIRYLHNMCYFNDLGYFNTPIHKYESDNQAVKLFNMILYEKIVDNNSIELLSKVPKESKYVLIQILIKIFKYDIKYSGVLYKRMRFANTMLIIISDNLDDKGAIETIERIYEIVKDYIETDIYCCYDHRKMKMQEMYNIIKKIASNFV